MKYIFASIFFLTTTFGFSQNQCGFNDVKMMGLHQRQKKSKNISNRTEVHTIPVVFHVIHLGEDVGVGTNISDEQILDGLRILNEDFRKVDGSWGDGNGVDVEIQFCLAQRDPNDNPTSGINRVNGNQWPLYVDEGIRVNPLNPGEPEINIKSATSWDRSSYMNVWIVSEIHGSNLNPQGFATLPTNSITDGIIILHNVIGSFGNIQSFHNMSRTLTHEVGHYLGLFHTFGMYQTCDNALSESDCQTQGDMVCDTPPTTPNLQCDDWCPGAQYENYMDYSLQSCKNMFTQGQKDRMRGVNGILNPFRISLLDSEGCIPVEGFNLSLKLPQVINECGTEPFKPQIEVKNIGTIDVYEFSVICSIQNSLYEVVKDCVLTTPLLPQNSLFVDFDYSSLGYGNHTINFNLVTEDIYDGDNSVTYEFNHEPSQEMTLIINTDFFGNETSWEVIDQNTQEIIWSQDGYPTGMKFPSVEITCIQNGCYDFVIYDLAGDGMQFGGDFTLLDASGNTLAYGEGDWGSVLTFPFCIENQTSENCEDLNNNGICDFDEEIVNYIEEPINQFGEIKQITNIRTFDISGRILSELENYQPGIYILMIEYEDGSYDSQKIFRWN